MKAQLWPSMMIGLSLIAGIQLTVAPKFIILLLIVAPFNPIFLIPPIFLCFPPGPLCLGLLAL